jgi:hypothetical protein
MASPKSQRQIQVEDSLQNSPDELSSQPSRSSKTREVWDTAIAHRNPRGHADRIDVVLGVSPVIRQKLRKPECSVDVC